MIARLEATVAFLADALTAFGDRDAEDLRRVKAVAVLANPVRAVELLAAFAALRSRDSVDVDRSTRTPTSRGRSTADEPDQPDAADHEPVVQPDALGPDGRVRPPGRVHPTPAARPG